MHIIISKENKNGKRLAETRRLVDFDVFLICALFEKRVSWCYRLGSRAPYVWRFQNRRLRRLGLRSRAQLCLERRHRAHVTHAILAMPPRGAMVTVFPKYETNEPSRLSLLVLSWGN